VDDDGKFGIRQGQVNFHGPISLHLEYEIPGATKAAQEENTLACGA
jgi:hypothetical protein